MRLLPVLLGLLLCACAPKSEPRVFFPDALPQVSGVIVGHLELSGELVMVDDIRVPAGSSLTIHPGTRIWVRPAESTKIDPEYLSSLTELLVEGRLRILGNGSAPVHFTPLKPLDPVPEGDPLWAGITLLPGAAGEFSGLQLERADSGLLLQGAEGSLHGVTLNGCRNGLIVQGGARVTIDHLEVNGGETGLFCWNGGVVAVSDSLFSGLDEEGLYLAAECSARLQNVVSRQNDTGLVAETNIYPGLKLEQNRFDFRQLGGAPR